MARAAIAPLPTLRRFTSGPVRLGYEMIGQGEPTMLVIPGLVSHIDYDLSRPEIRSFYQRLAAGHRLIRYDKRGCGLSDRSSDACALTLEAQVEDVERVLDPSAVRRATILAWSQGGPVAIAFAATHPERVSRLVLYGTNARLLAAPDYPCGQPSEVVKGLYRLVLGDWGLGSRPLMFATSCRPSRHRSWSSIGGVIARSITGSASTWPSASRTPNWTCSTASITCRIAASRRRSSTPSIVSSRPTLQIWLQGRA